MNDLILRVCVSQMAASRGIDKYRLNPRYQYGNSAVNILCEFLNNRDSKNIFEAKSL